MAMHMQDTLSFEIVRDAADQSRSRVTPGSPATTKAEWVFNPKAADPRKCWRSGESLVEKLIPASCTSFDVVSVVGPLAHGKSHSLNTRIFRDVLSHTAKAQHENALFEEQREADGSGTVGVWAAFNNYEKFLVFDTQGYHEKALFDVAEQDPTSVSAVRNAVKLMALSDVVVFHTSAVRIDPKETFRFLQEAAQIMESRLLPAIGRKTKPALVVFHQVLQEHPLDSQKFRSLLGDVVCNAFSNIHYMPTVRDTEKDFGALNAAITQEQTIPNRSNRQSLVDSYNILFSPETEWMPFSIEDRKAIVPHELFACAYKCSACGNRCSLLQHLPSKNHRDANGDETRCPQYNEALKNRAFYCRKCKIEASVSGYSADDYKVVQLFKYYTQTSNVINCENCKTIYRSDIGVWPPDEKNSLVETRVWHKWDLPRQNNSSNDAQATSSIAPTVFYSRALLDPLADATDSLASIFKPKAQSVQKFLLDNVRPKYWVPDEAALKCKSCSIDLPEPGLKHHCRQCGDIFCDGCSSHTQPVPERGWGEKPVRVCRRCYGTKFGLGDLEQGVDKESNVNGRWLFEQFGRVLSTAETVGGYIGGTIANQTMPDYWQKETDPGAHQCHCCHQGFEKSAAGVMQDSSCMTSSGIGANGGNGGGDKRRHHCRQCGKFVCGTCSPFRIAVPERGWGERPVRVCNNCFTSKSSSSSSALTPTNSMAPPSTQ